jgi:bifunctional DNA-binding transcriptional regulator/antitoxin component of YhaV-PrlF toxin-antitoxin module
MSDDDYQTRIVRPLRSGQVTIPEEFREKLGIGKETLLQMTLVPGELRIKPVPAIEEGSPWLRELYEYFAPVRQEILERGIPEEEVNADIDAAIAAVRRERRARRP